MAASKASDQTPAAKDSDGVGGLGLLVKAALPTIPVVGRLPGIRKAPASSFSGIAYHRGPVQVERGAVEAYAKVCGFPLKDVVPLPYPHMLAFGLHMAIMTDPVFPAPAIGTVHLENSITSRRPIAIGEQIDTVVRVGPSEPHPKGTLYRFVSEARVDGELVWEETSTYLRRGRGDEKASSGSSFPDAPASGTVWSLPADLGRTYAAVSGDRNPIHLYPVTAKALGFPRQIAHGMWTMARCVAALENRLPDAVEVDVAFKKPVLLPGRVAFGSAPVDGGYAFSLTNPRNGAPHLAGVTHAL